MRPPGNGLGNLPMDSSPHRIVERLTARIQDLETEFHRVYWDSQVNATSNTEQRRNELEIALRRAKGDAAALRAVNEALTEEVHDPILRRELEVLRLSLTGNQMDEARRVEIVEIASSVETDFATHRPQLDGCSVSENEIDEVLRASQDGEVRKRAWEASKEIGALTADRIRELARLRNATARDLGFADYYRMSLELQELGEEWLFRMLADVEGVTKAPFRTYKENLDSRLRRRFDTAELMPWHYADPFFQQLPPDGQVSLDELLTRGSAPDRARETFAAWGLHIGGVLERSDLYPRPGKCQHAFCLDVDRSGEDVRILANVVPGERWVEVMLHESGHAAYDVCIDSRLPYLLHRATHTFVTEAIAILCQRLVRNPKWLVALAGADAGDVERLGPALRSAVTQASLLFGRWVLVMAHFERDLYSDPEADLDALWWDYVERFQFLARPPGRRAPDWAAKIHTAVAPVYYHNYLLGEILASQLEAVCAAQCGGVVANEATGRFLVERVFKLGASLRWDSLIEQATGEPLNAAHFAAQLSV